MTVTYRNPTWKPLWDKGLRVLTTVTQAVTQAENHQKGALHGVFPNLPPVRGTPGPRGGVRL